MTFCPNYKIFLPTKMFAKLFVHSKVSFWLENEIIDFLGSIFQLETFKYHKPWYSPLSNETYD